MVYTAEQTDDLKQFSPTAMIYGLRAYRQLKNLPSNEQQAFFYEQFRQTPDAREGMAAFLEKRKPNWQT